MGEDKNVLLYQNSKVNNKTYVEDISYKILNGELLIDYYDKNVRNDFYFKDHYGKYGKSLENEKPLCRNWFNEGFPKELKELGFAIDYESNIILGLKTNIDLVSYSKQNKSLCLIEVKGSLEQNIWTSDETLLRAVLEIETYYLSLYKNNKIDKFKETISSALKDRLFDRHSIEGIKKYVVIPDKSIAAEMYKKPNLYPNLHKLIKALNINVLIFDEKYLMRNVGE